MKDLIGLEQVIFNYATSFILDHGVSITVHELRNKINEMHKENYTYYKIQRIVSELQVSGHFQPSLNGTRGACIPSNIEVRIKDE